MKHRLLFPLFFLLFSFSLFTLHAEEDLLVHLSSESHLAPLYLHSFEEHSSGFSSAYLEELEKVLRFDLHHNGHTFVVKNADEFKKQAAKEKGWKIFDKNGWNALNLHYIVKVSIADKKLNAAAFSVMKNAIKGVEALVLTGNLSEDRQQIHLVADAIQQAFFGTKGIASSRILYTVRKRSGENALHWQTDVWESDYDGANPRQITHDGALCVTPAYVPLKKGNHCPLFLFVSYKIGQPKIFLASTEEQAPKRLSLLRGNQLMPAISPKRDLVAFVSDITGNPELFVQSFHPEKGLLGKPHQVFSAPSGAQGSPTFSPDGRKIAFVSNKDGAPRIYTINLGGAATSLKDVKAHLISKQNKDNTCPAWSLDGTKIAYSALTKGVRQIWMYDFTTGKETALTEGSGHKENPTWGPDSLHLIFNSSTTTSSELYLINLHQKEAVKISSGPGEKRFPSWEP